MSANHTENSSQEKGNPSPVPVLINTFSLMVGIP